MRVLPLLIFVPVASSRPDLSKLGHTVVQATATESDVESLQSGEGQGGQQGEQDRRDAANLQFEAGVEEQDGGDTIIGGEGRGAAEMSLLETSAGRRRWWTRRRTCEPGVSSGASPCNTNVPGFGLDVACGCSWTDN